MPHDGDSCNVPEDVELCHRGKFGRFVTLFQKRLRNICKYQ